MTVWVTSGRASPALAHNSPARLASSSTRLRPPEACDRADDRTRTSPARSASAPARLPDQARLLDRGERQGDGGLGQPGQPGQVGPGTRAVVADVPEQQLFVERADELGTRGRHGPWHASRHDRHRRHQSCPNYYGRSTRQAERLSSLHRRRQENVGVATTTTNAGWRAGPQRGVPPGGRDRLASGPGPADPRTRTTPVTGGPGTGRPAAGRAYQRRCLGGRPLPTCCTEAL